MIAQSSTVHVIGPHVSNVYEFGSTPWRLMSPYVGLSPTPPHSAAGWRMEPPVSVPSAPSTNPAATAAPEPVLELPVKRVLSHGLRAGGHGRSVAGPPCASSCVASLPSSTAPAL